MAGEHIWYQDGTGSRPSSSRLGSGWSSLEDYLDSEGIVDLKSLSPPNGLQFCRETVMAKVFARYTKPEATTKGKQGANQPPGQRPCIQTFPPITGRQGTLVDVRSAAPYGAHHAYIAKPPPTQRPKKSRIPVPNTTIISRPDMNMLPAIATGKDLVTQNYSSIRHAVTEVQSTKRSDTKGLPKPRIAMCEALELLKKNDWEKKINGLQIIRSLSSHHPEIAASKIQELHATVISEVKNLRSAVSRAAMVCLGDMFEGLKDKMLYGLTTSTRILLQKSGDCNSFLRDAAEEALSSMALNIHPGRALAALIDGGISHLNPAIRSCAAKHLHNIILKSGADYILGGGKGITDRAIPAIARCAQDGCPEARLHGRKSLQLLADHPKLMPMLRKYVTPQNLPGIKKVLNKII